MRDCIWPSFIKKLMVVRYFSLRRRNLYSKTYSVSMGLLFVSVMKI